MKKAKTYINVAMFNKGTAHKSIKGKECPSLVKEATSTLNLKSL